ncbi:MAG TPA: hypothetical protein VFY24_03365 [Azospira sp.]|nr:hypothetical protein [Azospira sp.]
MNPVQTQWQQLGKRFDAYSARERALLAAALVGGSILLGNILFIDPVLARARQLHRQSEQQQVEAQTLQAQAGALKAQLQVDPDAGKKAEIVQRKGELLAVENELQALESDFVPPAQMNSLLEQLLSGQPRLRLLSLKSLPPVNLAATPSAGDAAATAKPATGEPIGLYRHGVELRLEGSYADLHAWLAQVEAAKQKLLWGDVRFRVVEHPRSQLSLTVYTLSTDKAWLAI